MNWRAVNASSRCNSKICSVQRGGTDLHKDLVRFRARDWDLPHLEPVFCSDRRPHSGTPLLGSSSPECLWQTSAHMTCCEVAEHVPACFLIHLDLERVSLLQRRNALRRRAGTDLVDQALQIRETLPRVLT